MTSLSLLAGRTVERLKKVNAKAFCQILTKSAIRWGGGGGEGRGLEFSGEYDYLF